jgi:hypothetical protein
MGLHEVIVLLVYRLLPFGTQRGVSGYLTLPGQQIDEQVQHRQKTRKAQGRNGRQADGQQFGTGLLSHVVASGSERVGVHGNTSPRADERPLQTNASGEFTERQIVRGW